MFSLWRWRSAAYHSFGRRRRIYVSKTDDLKRNSSTHVSPTPTDTHTLLFSLSLTLSLSFSLRRHTHTHTECISAEGSGKDNEVEIPDDKIATSITSDVDDSTTTDAADADEVGNDVNTEEEDGIFRIIFCSR